MTESRPGAGERRRLVALFGALYFLQGIGEPTDGLIAQPVRSLLKSWGRDAAAITAFSALVALPWSFKPLYGLLTDFVPIGGSRRRAYLIAASVVSSVSLFGLFARPVRADAGALLLACLLPATVAVAFADVVTDALMVEVGQPRGFTGRLQAVQWGCLYAAGLLTGAAGGLLAEGHRERWAFLLCGVGGLATLTLALVGVREPPRSAITPGVRETLGALVAALRSPTLRGVAAFLVLWNFNPFSNAVLYVHMTRELHWGERFYGHTVVLTALASIAASVGYGLYCRRVPMPILTHASIVLGIASTLGYLALADERSAVAVTLAVGFTYMTATLIQLDLAAQACPPAAAGTVFATLMALENLAASLSMWLGGAWYEQGIARWGSRTSFRTLVLVGSAFTAGCWLVLPLLKTAPRRHGEQKKETSNPEL